MPKPYSAESMKICIDVDEDTASALRILKGLYPELSFKEFIELEIKPQLRGFLRRNVENMLKQINWAYRIVRSVFANAER